MRKIVPAIIGITLMLAAWAYAYDDGDFQVWHTEIQESRINKYAKLTLEEEVRFGDDASNFYYHHYDIGFVYSPNKNLDLGINYRQVYEKKSGKFREENRAHLNATLKGEFFGLRLEDRNRLQYRHFDYQSDFWQYRNKFTARLPWKFTRIEIQPYLADEIFMDFKDKTFSRNRFYSGLEMIILKNLRAEVYYLLQSTRSLNDWIEANILGTKVKLLF